MKFGKFIFALIVTAIASVVLGQTEGDRIIAVIGNEIVTESDFQYQLQMYARQNQLTEISPYMAQQLFQSMITNKIILAKADQDSVTVTEDEVAKELDNRVRNMIDQIGSEQRVEEIYGMPIVKIRNIIKEDLQKNMKIEKLKRSRFQGRLKISDREIKEFYQTYKDSLPDVSEEFEIAHIFMNRKISDAEKQSARQKALQLLDSLKNGADFSEIARRNSMDSLSAIQGGDLGFARKGTFVKEFEEALYNLKEGEISDIVETEFGYHIIKLNEKQGDRVRSQHILVKYPKFESSDFETINFLNSLRDSIKSGTITFEDAAKKYSQDQLTKDKGGYVGKIPAEQIDSIAVIKLKEIPEGEVTETIRTGGDMNYGYEIYKLIKIYPPHKLSLDTDYERIKMFAETYKENKEMEKWINQIRETIYVNVKM